MLHTRPYSKNRKIKIKIKPNYIRFLKEAISICELQLLIIRNTTSPEDKEHVPFVLDVSFTRLIQMESKRTTEIKIYDQRHSSRVCHTSKLYTLSLRLYPHIK